MDNRSVVFLEVMIAVGVVGVVAFLIYLVTQYARRPHAATGDVHKLAHAPRWYEFLLATIVVAVLVLLLFWQFPPGTLPGLSPADWKTDPRSLTFFVVMVAIGGVGLVVFLIFVFWGPSRQGREVGEGPVRAPAAAGEAAAAEPSAVQRTPSAAPLLGLLVLALGFLILNWAHVPRAQQHSMMLHLVYPAGLAVALVMLFDKATRAWSVKGPAETVREWLFCDGIVFLLVLGYLNLLQAEAGGKYASMFWDFLHIALFFLVFWLVDRTVTRYRFLLAYAYLMALPILLLIWQEVQEAKAPEDLSWWSTIWPFFFLAVIFFVLEIISLVAARDSRNQIVPAIKDALFMVIYAILLIAAIPESGA